MISDQHCNHIVRKWGLTPTPELLAAIKEAFKIGLDYYVLKAEFKIEGVTQK